MKEIVNKIFKILYRLVWICIILCISSMIYNKIKYPKSPITIFGFQLYVDVTNSMVPDIHVNDIIVVKKCIEDSIDVGDIITYREGHTTITHRVIDIIDVDGITKYKTKGDNNNSEDDRLISYEEIEGKLFFKIRYLGFFIVNKSALILLILLLLTYKGFTESFGKKKIIEESL